MTTGTGAYQPVFGSGTRLAVRPRKSNAAPMLSVFFEAFPEVGSSSIIAVCLVIYL